MDKKLKVCFDCINCDQCPTGLACSANSACKMFKDKSNFVELPCKEGDKIFMIVGDIEAGDAFVDEGKVISVIYEGTGVWISARYGCGLFYHHKFGSGDYFFTIEEAEKALAERKEK